MISFLKNIDLEQVRDQILEIKDQVEEMKFRKPWSNSSDTSPVAYMAIGAAISMLGLVLYKNRVGVASFLSNRGAELKDKWETSGIKDQAGNIMGKAKSAVKDSASTLKETADRTRKSADKENYQPT